jgi:phosphohistidine swiveling domain-containing protein
MPLKSRTYLKNLKSELSVDETGNKAQSLLFLKKHNARIPEAWIVISRAYDDYRKNRNEVIDVLKSEIGALPDVPYAIRSSSSCEDSGHHSYAGQFKSLLNIRGAEEVVKAVEEVWIAAGQVPENEYGRSIGGDREMTRCAVIIQRFITPVLSGVSFSRNPVNQLHEVVVEAVEGWGEDLVQKGVTPYRWRWKGRQVIEGDPEYRFLPVIEIIAKKTKALDHKFGAPVDIEWAYDGRQVFYLQLRRITGQGPMMVYSNRMAREMLPGQIKPLVWSVNIPLVNGTKITLLQEITGPLPVRPEELAKSFYYRVYFNMAALGKIFREFGLSAESIEIMMLGNSTGMPRFKPGINILKHTFRIIRFLTSKLHFEPFFIREYPLLQSRFYELQEEIKRDFSLLTYPALFEKLFVEGQKIAYLNTVVPFLMQFYNKKLRKRFQKLNVDYDLIDFNAHFPELNELSPVKEMESIRRKIDRLASPDHPSFATLGELVSHPQSAPVLEDFQKFIRKFGHFSESGNDFSVQKWEENPEFVYQMILQSGVEARLPAKEAQDALELYLKKSSGLRKLFQKAGKFKVHREKASSLYIFGYGLFRMLFLYAGREFAKRGILVNPDDIFYLRREEIDQILGEISNNSEKNVQQIIEKRKKEMDDCKDIVLPAVIYGDEAPVADTGNLKNMHGVGTSPGHYKGRTKIVKSTEDFSQVNTGDILVIPFSDVSWTPILVKAGAIVSEAGGMLSHCSIIARELGIPALVSVDNACSVENGRLATVDGSNGLFTIHDDE